MSYLSTVLRTQGNIEHIHELPAPPSAAGGNSTPIPSRGPRLLSLLHAILKLQSIVRGRIVRRTLSSKEPGALSMVKELHANAITKLQAFGKGGIVCRSLSSRRPPAVPATAGANDSAAGPAPHPSNPPSLLWAISGHIGRKIAKVNVDSANLPKVVFRFWLWPRARGFFI